MTLAELSMEYEASAGLISGRLAELRLALRQEEDAETAVRLRRRIETLRPMLTQCRTYRGSRCCLASRDL